jgi:hypothetical protein
MTNNRIFSQSLALVALLLPWTATAARPAVCSVVTTPPAAAANNATAQHLMDEERASWDLAIARNAAAYRAFHAPDFFTLTETGVVQRAASEASAMDAQVRFDRCTLSAFDVHVVADDAMLVTYRVEAAGLNRGKVFRLDSYASSLWTKRDGKWLNVFYQATPAPNR